MSEIINKKTGEVYKARFGEVLRLDVPFRSKTDLKNYSDNEYYEEGTSLTDPSQVLNVKETVQRMMRGEMIMPDLKAGQYDVDLHKMTIDEAFETEDPTRAPGFDLADIPSLAEQLKSAAPTSQVPTAPVAPEAKDNDSDHTAETKSMSKKTASEGDGID